MFHHLKTHGVKNIVQVKYLAPYKFRLTLGDELNVIKLCSCELLIAKGWKFTRHFDVNFIYGLSEDVDYEIKVEDIFNDIRIEHGRQVFAMKWLKDQIVIETVWKLSKSIIIIISAKRRPLPNIGLPQVSTYR